jgi:hypothetical protein
MHILYYYFDMLVCLEGICMWVSCIRRVWDGSRDGAWCMAHDEVVGGDGDGEHGAAAAYA